MEHCQQITVCTKHSITSNIPIFKPVFTKGVHLPRSLQLLCSADEAWVNLLLKERSLRACRISWMQFIRHLQFSHVRQLPTFQSVPATAWLLETFVDMLPHTVCEEAMRLACIRLQLWEVMPRQREEPAPRLSS